MSVQGLEASKYLYVGIFTDEKVLQLLQLLTSMADHCFQELHQVAAEKSNKVTGLLIPSELQPSSAYGVAFQAGLHTISGWSTSVLQQEVDRLKKQCPYVEELYKYSVVRYLQEIYRYEKNQTISVSVPLLREFIHQFYCQVASNPLTRNLKYFSTFGLEKKTLLMDAVRGAMFRLLENQIDFQTSLQPTQTAEKPTVYPWNNNTQQNEPTTSAPKRFAALPPTPLVARAPAPPALQPLPPPINPTLSTPKKAPIPIPTFEEIMKNLKASGKPSKESAKPAKEPAKVGKESTKAKPPPTPKKEQNKGPKEQDLKTIEIDLDAPLPDSDDEKVASSKDKGGPSLFDDSSSVRSNRSTAQRTTSTST